MRNTWRYFGREGLDKVVAETDRAVVVAMAAAMGVVAKVAVVVVKVVAEEDEMIAIETRNKEIVIQDQSAEAMATPDNAVEDQELEVEDERVVASMQQ